MLDTAQPEPVIPVADLDRAISFYCDKLGLKLHERYDVPAQSPMARVEAGNGTIAIYKSVGAGQSRHTIASFVVDDIESAVEDLRNRGVTFEEYEMGDIKTQNGIAPGRHSRGVVQGSRRQHPWYRCVRGAGLERDGHGQAGQRLGLACRFETTKVAWHGTV